MAMKMKKVGTGKSHGAYSHIPCRVTSQESILSKGWKTTQTCWPLRSNNIFLILHQVPVPTSHLLTSSLPTAILIPCLLKPADFLILLLMAVSQTQQHLKALPLWANPTKWGISIMRCDMHGKAWPAMLGERACHSGVEPGGWIEWLRSQKSQFSKGRHSLALRWEGKLTLLQ